MELVSDSDSAESHIRMKRLFTVVALLALVGSVLLTGCKKEETPEVPEVPSTNAPVVP